TFSATVTALVPSAPQLTPLSDTGISHADGITQDNGSSTAPLTFTVGGVVPGNGYVQLYNVNNPTDPILLGNPVQATNGTATITISGTPPLADGTYKVAATTSANTVSTPSALSAATTITIATSLRVVGISPTGNYLTSLSNNQIVVTFNHWLTGLVPDQANGSGFASNPYAVVLIPSGSEGGARSAAGETLWSAPTGYDSGDVATPATLVYHQNTNGTSTITLTPDQPLATDVYLVSVNGLTDVAGNTLTDSNGNPAPVYDSFTFQASPADTTALEVKSVTTNNGTVAISNNVIPQPDTIAIAFNKAMDPWSINSDNIQLLVQTATGTYVALPSVVAYSPSTLTAYLTPEVILSPGSVYVVTVNTSVTDDQAFPVLGTGLSQVFATSFTVSGTGVSGQHSPLTVTATSPANGAALTSSFGYGAVTFSERISLSALGRYSAMLIPQTGGVTTGNSGYADVPLNATLAFNPNTDQLIIVPTGLVPNDTVYLFALSGVTASNGDSLTVPGGGTTYYASFLVSAPVTSSSTPSAVFSATPSVVAPSIVTGNPAAAPAVAHPPTASTARAFAASLRPGRPGQALDRVLHGAVTWVRKRRP
ncbi:MAG: Ig-like domain-containing protein, partial [Isosphaeraceae bacterium]|nr:Ig-like domain-containing protein [Isosphaeraceae bacterium]